MRRLLLHVIVTLVYLCTLTCLEQTDPINNMCIRFDHQSVIKNKTLYIDGGRQTFIDIKKKDGKTTQIGSITQGYNAYVIAIDLTESWNWKTNISERATKKDINPATGTRVPILSRGALYSGNETSDTIFLWGGTTSPWNKSAEGYRSPLGSQYSLWSYNTSDSVWGQVDTGLSVPNRPNSGAATEAPDLNLAFYMNGQLDNGSQVDRNYLYNNDSKPFLEGMIVIDTKEQTAKNLSTAQVVGNMPRSRARMEYVKELGPKGILVTIGGNQKNVNDQSNQFVGDLLPMDTVDVFDVASYYNTNTPDGTWYKQRTTGDIPPPRIDHCTIMASSSDLSSHNIYLYGGRAWNGSDNVVYDDLYILSLPSFTWTQVYQGSAPRYAHTCHRANAKSMITVGGARNFNYTKAPCDWETKGVGVLDMSEIQWGSIFDANANNYQLPLRLVSTIGGTRNGGATLKQPVKGFDQEGLAKLLNGTWNGSKAARTRRSSIPFIIGGTLGGVIIAGTVIGLTWFYRRRLKILISTGEWPAAELDAHGQTMHEMDPDAVHKAEMSADDVRQELPAVITSVEASCKPVELCGRESDLPWQELGTSSNGTLSKKFAIRGSGISWRTSQATPPPPWEPPVTEQGVPF